MGDCILKLIACVAVGALPNTDSAVDGVHLFFRLPFRQAYTCFWIYSLDSILAQHIIWRLIVFVSFYYICWRPHWAISSTVPLEIWVSHFISSSWEVTSWVDPYPSIVFRIRISNLSTFSSGFGFRDQFYEQCSWSSQVLTSSVFLSPNTTDPSLSYLSCPLWTSIWSHLFSCGRIYEYPTLARSIFSMFCSGWCQCYRVFPCAVRRSDAFCFGRNDLVMSCTCVNNYLLNFILQFFDNFSVLDLTLHESLLYDDYFFL